MVRSSDAMSYGSWVISWQNAHSDIEIVAATETSLP